MSRRSVLPDPCEPRMKTGGSGPPPPATTATSESPAGNQPSHATGVPESRSRRKRHEGVGARPIVGRSGLKSDIGPTEDDLRQLFREDPDLVHVSVPACARGR